MSAFMVELEQVGQFTSSAPARQYDDEMDGLTAILVDACEALASSGHTRFIVRGFGQDPWPVDVRCDLSVVVEQVPDAIGALRRDEATTLGFWEQGIQRVLNFTPHGKDVTVDCASMTDWEPAPALIEVSRLEVLSLLDRFLDSFVRQVSQCCPDLAEHPWFRSWLALASSVG